MVALGNKAVFCSTGNYEMEKSAGMSFGPPIKILGGDSPEMAEMKQAVAAAARRLGIEDYLEHIRDEAKIKLFRPQALPALYLNGSCLSAGKYLSEEEAAALLAAAGGK